MRMISRNIFILIVILAVLLAALVYFFFFRKESPSDPYLAKLEACDSIPNGWTKFVKNTERVFINLPIDVYPDREKNLEFITVRGDAKAGYVSNAGPSGEAENAPEGCWSYYYEFSGTGEIDLVVKSQMQNMPDYFLRFVME